MKRLFTFLLCVFLSATAIAQSIDTVTTEEWKNNAWSPANRIIYTYNSGCQPVTMLVQTWQDGSGLWADTLLTEYEYNQDNLISLATTKIRNTNTSTWDNGVRMTYLYDGSNNNDSLLTEIWISNQWKNLSLTANQFNPDGTVNRAVTQIWLGAIWFNVTKSTYSYNPDKTVSQVINEQWQLVSWKNGSRLRYTYSAQANVLTEYADAWKSGQWKDSARITNTYDGSNYMVNSLSEKWNNSTSVWENIGQTTFTNNPDGTVAVSVSQVWNKNNSAWVNESRSTYHYTSCTLPVKLLEFSATANGKAVQIEWTTATEINSRNFIIQRSNDGSSFVNIGTVNATGNSTTKTTYRFTDAGARQPGAPVVYYRLQMNDQDGSFNYSNVEKVNLVSLPAQPVTIFPNPVRDNLNLSFSIAAAKITVKVFDQYGRSVYQQQLNNVQPGLVHKINTSALKQGVYFVQWQSGTETQSIRFVK